jgi:Notch-like protein
MSAETLKHIALFIPQPLAEIVNRSFCSGLVPDSLKIARVRPIFKSGDPAECTNNRPISVLSSFSKVFEKLVHYRLVNDHTQHSILYKYYYMDFRAIEAGIEIVDKVTLSSGATRNLCWGC